MRSTPPHKALPCLPYQSYLSRAFLSLVSPSAVVVVSHWDKLSLSPLGLWAYFVHSVCTSSTPLSSFPCLASPFSVSCLFSNHFFSSLILSTCLLSRAALLNYHRVENEYWGRQLFLVIETPPPPGGGKAGKGKRRGHCGECRPTGGSWEDSGERPHLQEEGHMAGFFLLPSAA